MRLATAGPLMRGRDPHHTLFWPEVTLASLGVLAALYVARSLMLPLVLALLISLLLAPLVSLLARWFVPRGLGAALIMVALAGVLILGGYLLADPAQRWIDQAPRAINELQQKLAPITQKLNSVSEAAVDATTDGQATEDVDVETGSGLSMRDAFLQQAREFGLGFVLFFFLLYFLLACSDQLKRNLMRALATEKNRQRVLGVLQSMQRRISRYLLTITVINSVLGALVALLTWWFDLPNPLLWGVVAGTLNFVPYLGPMVTLTVLLAVAITSLPTASAVSLGLIFFALTSLEGQLITPTIVGRNVALNPVFVFLALIFWGWLWGVIGALLAIPIMVSCKIVCDEVPRLKPLGIMLGRSR
ncbi:MAG: hypothetical protein CMN28_13700 [Salinisphaeraceae bacterium]|nr:hypothetical protein [Salinisphaeraceae bacterium]